MTEFVTEFSKHVLAENKDGCWPDDNGMNIDLQRNKFKHLS